MLHRGTDTHTLMRPALPALGRGEDAIPSFTIGSITASFILGLSTSLQLSVASTEQRYTALFFSWKVGYETISKHSHFDDTKKIAIKV